MRAHLADICTAVVAALVLIVAITVGGALSIITGVSAAAFALSLRALGVALLKSMEPQTRHEKRTMQRITQSLKSNMAQLRLKNEQDARVGGGV